MEVRKIRHMIINNVPSFCDFGSSLSQEKRDAVRRLFCGTTIIIWSRTPHLIDCRVDCIAATPSALFVGRGGRRGYGGVACVVERKDKGVMNGTFL